MSNDTTSWSEEITPESTLPSMKMPESEAKEVDDWGFWGTTTARSKKEKKKARKIAQVDNDAFGVPLSSTAPEAVEKVDWLAPEPQQLPTFPEPQSTKSSQDLKSLEAKVKALSERFNQLDTKYYNAPLTPPTPPQCVPSLLKPNLFANPPLPPPSFRTPFTYYYTAADVQADKAQRAAVDSLRQEACFRPTVHKGLDYTMAAPSETASSKREQSTAPYPPRPTVSTASSTEAPTSTTHIRSRPLARPTHRSRSVSPSSNSMRSSIDIRNYSEVTSHTELILSSKNGSTPKQSDMVATITPFDRKVYISYHDATSIDLKQYLPLLKYAQAEQWYTIPSEESAKAITEWEEFARFHGKQVSMEKVREYMPSIGRSNTATSSGDGGTAVSQTYTRINAGRALRLQDERDDGDNNEAAYRCAQRIKQYSTRTSDTCIMNSCTNKDYADCSHGPWYSSVNGPNDQEQRLPRSEFMSELQYLSVVQAVVRDNPSEGVPGSVCYKVVRTGSRCAAAAQAFFDAGANGWSTVFVCALPAHLSVLSEVAGFAGVVGVRCAKSIDEVLVREDYWNHRWMRILY